MDFQEYFYKLTIFHNHLQTDYGLLIKAATCIAFGAVCGWIMALLAWILYKITIYLDAVPVAKYNYLDDDLDLESESETGYDADIAGPLRQLQPEDNDR